MADDQNKSSVNVDAGLSLKAEVKTEVSRESSSRLLDALTDIIRPFSESRGLRADQIRLQREDVLIEIARKTHKRLDLEFLKPEPVPNKFMVPFLEYASCEDLNSKLCDRWSSLLYSAAMTYDSKLIAYTKFLSQLDQKEISFLDLMVDKNIERSGIKDPRAWRAIGHLERLPNVSDYLLPEQPFSDTDIECRDDFWCRWVQHQNNIGPRVILSVGFPMTSRAFGDEPIKVFMTSPTDEDLNHQFTVPILESLGLISKHSETFRNSGSTQVDTEVKVEFVSITALGMDFVNVCSGRKIDV